VSIANDRVRSTSAQRWVLSITGVAALIVILDALVVSTALSAIKIDLGASIEELEWTVNGYVLSFAVLLMTASALGDRYGRRRVFVTGLAVFAAASGACALAPGIGWLIAARAVQGTGAALVMPLALAQLTAAFPPERRPRALGVFTALTGIAVPLGPLLGGAVVEGISWQWIFWLNVPTGAALIGFTLRRIEEQFAPPSAIDMPGIALVTGAALGVVWGLVRGNPSGWTSPEVLAALGAGALLGTAFVVWEARTRAPMLPLRLFRSVSFTVGNTAIFLLYASTLGALFFMAQLLQSGLHFGPLGAGVRLVPWGATTFVVPLGTGRLITRLGERPFIVGGMCLHAVSMAWIAFVLGPSVAYAELVVPLILSGAGVAMALPATQSSVLRAVAPSDIGHASGAFSTLRQLGGAFGVAAVVAVFSARGSYAAANEFIDGVSAALGACALLSLVGAAVGLVLRPERAKAKGLLAPAVATLDTVAT
jgi:EmrB/QacA subfamily drug resistance transporter